MAASSSSGESADMREAFGDTLVELGHAYPTMIVLDADLHTSSKATRFRDAFPHRFIQVGIAEQNMFGIAAGLALSGFIPFPSTFAAFATRRALDQIAISICYPRLNVKIPGSYVGLPTSRAGASHNCIEDVAVMRAMPNLRVADPGDDADLRAIMHAAIEVDGPVYFRIARYAAPALFGPGHKFEWGKGVVLRDGDDVTLFGTGIMTGHCLLAAELLADSGIKAQVVHMASVKPIDRDLIATCVARTRCAVTAENATISGGFGSAVAETLALTLPVPLRFIGVPDRWADSGGIDELFAYHRMRPADIAEAARQVIALKSGLLTR